MIFFTSAYHRLNFVRLRENMDHLTTTATWVDNEWGYIRNKGLAFRKELFTNIADYIYVAMLGSQPVGMMIVTPYEFNSTLTGRTDKLPKMSELVCLYVEKEYRNMGFGRQLIDEAKRIASASNTDFLVLDTLKTGLNSMYKKNGAEVVCENHLYSHPTDVLTMKV
ncbi:MAG: N-acetyltransferase [Legionella sp.]|nr:MAG: N-acetyltransferase [Legionella sp.]